MASLFQEVILEADLRCVKCQERVANAISNVNKDVESMEVHVMEKKVILTCKSVTVSEGSSVKSAAAFKNNR